jgi:hypothetical protein
VTLPDIFRRRRRVSKPLHQQHPDLTCQVCAGAGNVYQDGRCIVCHVCGGKGITDVPRDGYGKVIPLAF